MTMYVINVLQRNVIFYLVNDEKKEIEIHDVFYCRENYGRFL